MSRRKRHRKREKIKPKIRLKAITQSVHEEVDKIAIMFRPGEPESGKYIEFLKEKSFDLFSDILVIPRTKQGLFLYRPTLSIIMNCTELAIVRSGGYSNFMV